MQKVVHGTNQVFREEHPEMRIAKANLARLAGMEAPPRHIPTTQAQAKEGILVRLKRRFLK